MPRLDLVRRPQPFIGLLLVAGGWALSHQIGSDSVFDDCGTAGGPFVVLVSALGLLVVAAGGLYGLSAWRRRDADNGPEGSSGRAALGIVVALLALLAGFGVVLQIAAALILPTCFG